MHIKQKKSKDIYYFCIDEDDKDLNTALSLIKKYEDQDKEIQKHTHIYVLTEQKDVDLMLDSSFETEEDLKNYAVHPAHVAVADGKVRPFTKLRSCLDFNV